MFEMLIQDLCKTISSGGIGIDITLNYYKDSANEKIEIRNKKENAPRVLENAFSL